MNGGECKEDRGRGNIDSRVLESMIGYHLFLSCDMLLFLLLLLL